MPANRAAKLGPEFIHRQTMAGARRYITAELAALDLAAALAEHAAEGGWVRPIVESGTALEIAGGRHPTVEAALCPAAGKFRAVSTATVTTDRSGARFDRARRLSLVAQCRASAAADAEEERWLSWRARSRW